MVKTHKKTRTAFTVIPKYKIKISQATMLTLNKGLYYKFIRF